MKVRFVFLDPSSFVFCLGGSFSVVLGLVFFEKFKILYSFIELFSR